MPHILLSSVCATELVSRLYKSVSWILFNHTNQELTNCQSRKLNRYSLKYCVANSFKIFVIIKGEPFQNTRESTTKKEEEKKKEVKKVLKIMDQNLLLSFTYFDTTRGGYIYDRDLEDLLFSLGLALSRSQVCK